MVKIHGNIRRMISRGSDYDARAIPGLDGIPCGRQGNGQFSRTKGLRAILGLTLFDKLHIINVLSRGSSAW